MQFTSDISCSYVDSLPYFSTLYATYVLSSSLQPPKQEVSNMATVSVKVI